MVKVLIVEDEPNYSDTLEMFVDELGYLVSGVAPEGEMATRLFRQEQPDIVLMDIHLEGQLSGVELARRFQKAQPTPIIFITSFSDKETFAKAKETAPSAYLTKPFDPEALERSMELAIQQAFKGGGKFSQSNSNAVLAPGCFFIKERNRLVKINQYDILWIEVEDKYCMLHSTERTFALRLSLKDLAQKLDPEVFVQTHRSYLVNAPKIKEIDTHTYVVRIGEKEIPLGKTHKEELLNRLNML